MAEISSTVIRKRVSRRIIQDLPLDLEELEMDDPVLVMVRVRDVLAREQRSERGKRPAERKPRFGIPSTPLTSRLRSGSGLQSFHLSVGKTLRGSVAGYDGYATDGARADREAGVNHIATAPARDLDTYMLDHGAGDEPAPISLTNLDPADDVRGRQWAAIEEEEYRRRRNPEGGPPRIAVRYETAPDFLLAMAQRNDCPAGLRDVILRERDRVASGRPLAKQHRRDGVPWLSDEASAAMDWIQTLPGWTEQCGKAAKESPVRLSKGRGTVAVHRGELELPRSFDRVAIENVMAGLDAYLQAQRSTDQGHASRAGDKDLIPSMFAVHRPGALNDRRNLHLHFLHGTRAVMIGKGGELRFADTKVAGMAAMGWTKRLRREAARLMNVELERLDAEYRLSPDSYAAMGIDASTQRKLDSERTVLERAGVHTDAGLANSTEGWQRKLVQAKQRHIDAELALGSRDSIVGARIERLDDARRKQLEAEREAALAAERQALRLRFEAEEIAIWIAMARSAPEQTTRFASGYADKAKRKNGRDSYDSACWRERGQAAEDHLAMLDRDLADERMAIAKREQEAERAMGAAARHWERIDVELSRPAEPASAERPQAAEAVQMVPARALDTAVETPHLTPAPAVTRIARASLMVSHTGKGYIILPIDDPDGLVAGIDLSSQQARLKGVWEAQQKELRQLVALVRKRGFAALEDEALDAQSDWIRRSALKWRDSGALRRRVAQDLAAAWHESHAPDAGAQDLLPALPLTPERPRGPADVIGEMVFAPDIPHLAPVPARLSIAKTEDEQPVAAVPEAAPVASPPSSPPPVESVAEPGASTSMPGLPVEDRRFAEHADWMLAREREHIQTEMEEAIRARAEDGTSPTPHAARLLSRVLAGFDPDKVDRRVPLTGRTPDQFDADEIVALRYSPVFAGWERAARHGDPTLREIVMSRLVEDGRADPLARVSRRGPRLDFALGASGVEPRAPRDWIERDLANAPLEEIRLSRHRGLVGLFDRRVLDAVHHNHVGLLYPDVQLRLEVRWRLQREEDKRLLRQIGTGRVKVDARLRHDRATDRITSQVDARGELAAHPSMVRGRHDPEWYVACRKAQLGVEIPPPERHPDLEIAAWLRARDEQASPALLARMAASLRKRKEKPVMAGLTDADAKALAALFVVPAVIPRSDRSRKRRRGTPPLRPGRDGPGR